MGSITDWRGSSQWLAAVRDLGPLGVTTRIPLLRLHVSFGQIRTFTTLNRYTTVGSDKMYKLVAASIICFTSAQSVAAQTAEVKVLAGGGLSKVVAQSGAVFEHRTGHKLVLQFGEPGALKREIEAGTTFDVVILDRAVIDDLIKLGKIAPDSPVEIARVGMGVAVRNGAPKPDIGSVDAFKRAILDAKSLAY